MTSASERDSTVFSSGEIYSSDCVLDKSANVPDNEAFTATGDALISGKPWAQYSTILYFGAAYAGRDHNSTVAKYPTDKELVGWAEEMLGFAQYK